jgi:hypothetical protein
MMLVIIGWNSQFLKFHKKGTTHGTGLQMIYSSLTGQMLLVMDGFMLKKVL